MAGAADWRQAAGELCFLGDVLAWRALARLAGAVARAAAGLEATAAAAGRVAGRVRRYAAERGCLDRA